MDGAKKGKKKGYETGLKGRGNHGGCTQGGRGEVGPVRLYLQLFMFLVPITIPDRSELTN